MVHSCQTKSNHRKWSPIARRDVLHARKCCGRILQIIHVQLRISNCLHLQHCWFWICSHFNIALRSFSGKGVRVWTRCGGFRRLSQKDFDDGRYLCRFFQSFHVEKLVIETRISKKEIQLLLIRTAPWGCWHLPFYGLGYYSPRIWTPALEKDNASASCAIRLVC